MLQTVPDNHLDMILDAAAEKYKRMKDQSLPPIIKPEDIQQDFKGTPQSESAEGENAGNAAVNNVIPEANSVLDTGQAYKHKQDFQEYLDQTDAARKAEDEQAAQAGRGPANILTGLYEAGKRLVTGDVSSSVPEAQQPKNQALDVSSWMGKAGQPATQAPSAGATTANVVNTVPDINATVGEPKFAQENIGTVSKKQIAELAPSEAIQKAQKDINKLQETSPEDYQAVAKATAEAQKSAADAAVKSGEAVVANIPLLQQRQKELYDKADAVTENLNNIAKIDPNRIWNNGSTGNKIAFVISAMAGGLQAGGALDTLIKNDIAAQVKNAEIGSENNRGILNMFLRQGENMQQAIQSTMAYYPHLIQAYKDQAQVGVAASPQATLIAANTSYNAAQKAKIDAETKLAQADLSRQKENISIQEKNAEFQKQAEQSQIEAQKYKQQTERFTPQAGEAAQHYTEAKQATDKMLELERKGIKRVDMSSLLTDTDFKSRAANSFNAGAFGNVANEVVKRLFPEVKDSATKSDLAQYYTEAFRYAAAAAKSSGARVSKDTIDQFMRLAVPEPGLSSKALAEVQLNRAKDVKNMLLKGGPAAKKIIEQNK